ncbi:MAG: riboflavin biosynthesis protein RibF [Bacteroidota bacterium]|nr:riboflavin biosynthesis protein RibF [Bacteroidota bacterium]
MKVVTSIADIQHNKNSVISVGTFDGVHRAHQKIIGEVVSRAKVRSGRSVIVTFEPHPKEVLAAHHASSNGSRAAHPPEILTTLQEKLALFEPLEVDAAVVIAFTYEFSRKSFRDFYTEYIINRIGASEVIEGYDHSFGRDREAGLKELLELGTEFHFSVVAEQPFKIDNEIVGSSRIRSLLLEGKIREANKLLGRNYSFSGTVVRGDMRGRTLGFPTANIHVHHPRKLVPRNGIYAVRVLVGSSQHFGLMNVGVLPTFFDSHPRKIEAYIYDFDEDIYEQPISVECLDWIRDEQKFPTVDALIAQMNDDKRNGMKIIKSIT